MLKIVLTRATVSAYSGLHFFTHSLHCVFFSKCCKLQLFSLLAHNALPHSMSQNPWFEL